MPFTKKNGRFISKKEDDRTRKFVEMISRKLPGRRVVDVDILAKNLSCEVCGLSLSLTNITDEQRHGLGSYFHIRCECKHMNKIATGKNHQSKLKGPPVFDVNTKTAAAMIHVGLGPTQIAETLSVMNIPPPTVRTLKKREREIGPTIEKSAKKSCAHAVQKIEKEGDGINEITASYDMGWQRRSAGKTYNSMSGHGSLIEKDSGKLIAYGCRITCCRTCDVASLKNKPPKPHDCRKNWAGSSKAMEQSVAVELVSEVRSDSAAVTTIVMDDDSTTLAHLRKEYDADLVKWSDINHAKKSFTNMLYKLSEKHKILTSSRNKIINYLRKCFSYAISQCDKKSIILSQNLRQIPLHIFGEHAGCSEWCGATRDGEYKYSSLPHGKPLQDLTLKQDLMDVFEIFALNSERLAPGGSTKVNESFNNIVASKAPKSKHYSSSESFCYRLGAAAAQKNEGKSYVCEVFQEHSLSPSLSHQKRSVAHKQIASVRAATEQTKVFKNRRNELRERRNKKTNALQSKEGPTYQRCIGLNGVRNLDQKFVTPEYVPKPSLVNFAADGCDLIYLDVETSGATSDQATSLCQVAMMSNSKGAFNVYIRPETQITPFVQKLTGLSLNGNTLCHMGKALPTMTLTEAMIKILDFIELHEKPVALVAHNSRACDAPLMSLAMRKAGLFERFSMCVRGFIDTLPLFKSLYPENYKLSQEALCEKLIGMKYSAHNAADDCCALKSLVEFAINEHAVQFSNFSSSLESTCSLAAWNDARKEKLRSFSHARSVSALSAIMASKCAGSGLVMDDLVNVYLVDGETGVLRLLSEQYNGVARVTKSQLVINKICGYLQKHTNQEQR